MAQNGTTTQRRRVTYRTLGDVLDDAERLAASGCTAAGNWSAGRVFAHLGETVGLSIDGFRDAKMPLPVAILGRVMRPVMLRMAPPSGIKAPPSVVALFKAPEDVTTEQGLAILREQTARAGESDAMNAVSPVLGKLGPREWVMFHCRHAELHMSFLRPAGG